MTPCTRRSACRASVRASSRSASYRDAHHEAGPTVGVSSVDAHCALVDVGVRDEDPLTVEGGEHGLTDRDAFHRSFVVADGIWSPPTNGWRKSSRMPANRFSRMSWNAKPMATEKNPRPARRSTGCTEGNVTASREQDAEGGDGPPRQLPHHGREARRVPMPEDSTRCRPGQASERPGRRDDDECHADPWECSDRRVPESRG